MKAHKYFRGRQCKEKKKRRRRRGGDTWGKSPLKKFKKIAMS